MKFGDMFKRHGLRSDADNRPGEGEAAENVQRIGAEQIKKAAAVLAKYKAGKVNLEKRVIANEQFWKLRQWEQYSEGNRDDIRPASAWLWQSIVSKHADYTAAYPSPNILPRMEDDKAEAGRLSSIMPIILEQCKFRRTYDDVTYYKLKQGTGVYGVFWDQTKHNGIGDISIKKVDLLKIFWEPGITDIQDSANIFVCELCDNDTLKRKYPDISENLPQKSTEISKYIYDDSIDTTDKSLVVDWYYKVEQNGKTVLHFCKFCGTTVLYASENDTEQPTDIQFDPVSGTPVEVPSGESIATRGWYSHGKYPFVFDVLYPVEGSPCGYGYTDIGRDIQREIDVLNQAMVKNALCGAKPRFFIRADGGVNEEEYADYSNDLIHVTGNLTETNVRPIDYSPLQGNYIELLNLKIDELKEITGNRDVNNGGSASGITAASAIATMQEAGGKMSRDGISSTYDAYNQVVYLCIELMREYYKAPRYFRILGESGDEQFTAYNNAGLVPQSQGTDFGIDMGYRVPEFDIEVTAEKASAYKRMEQNELALQLYGAGVFAPQNSTQAMMLLETMDFNGKEAIMQRVAQNGTIYEMLLQYQQMALSLASKYEPETAQMIAGAIAPEQMGAAGARMNMPTGANAGGEPANVEKARAEAQERTQPT